MERFSKIYENKVELAGRYAFNIFLDIIQEYGHHFMKQNYLNMGTYNYFFTTDKITQKEKILHDLEKKTSLQTAYLTLKSIKDLRLSFFFAIRERKAFFGFFNEDNGYVYKVGIFDINDTTISNLLSKDIFKNLRKSLENVNLKKMELFQVVKVEFPKLFKGFESKSEILDEERIRNTYDIDIFNPDDLDYNRLVYTLESWARGFKWYSKFYYYVHVTEKYVHFYIKWKEF